MRQATLSIPAWMVALALVGAQPAFAAETVGPAPAGKLTVVLLPAKVVAMRLEADTMTTSQDWTAMAEANLDTGLKEAVGHSTKFDGVPMPALTREQRGAVDEFAAVAALVATQASGRAAPGNATVPPGTIDRTLGSSLAFLRERTGADYALAPITGQVGRGKLKPLLDLASALSGPKIPSGPALAETSNFAGLVLVDLGTGEIRWFNLHGGHEYAGVDFADLRDPGWVGNTLRQVLAPYPDIPPLHGEAGTPSAVTTALSRRLAWPPDGEFAIRAPDGWLVREDATTVVATHDGALLNQIKVECRDHEHALPMTAQQTTRDSTPERLAQWYAAELRRQDYADLQISETSVNAQLAGRTAFRVRFSYVQPGVTGGARIEQVTVGAAVSHGLLLAQFSAPQLTYFAKALPAFEESVRTVVLRPRRHLQ